MKPDGTMRVGIIGTGWIAEKAAITLNGLSRGLRNCEAYAVGSRTKDTAEAFAKKWSIGKSSLMEKLIIIALTAGIFSLIQII